MTDVARPRRRTSTRTAGVLLVLAATLGYGMGPTLANLAYAGGADPFTVVMSNYLAGTFVVLPIVGRRRVINAFRATRPRVVFALCVALMLSSLGYMTAVLYVPVGVAVTVFYLFPIVVTVLARIVDKSPITMLRVIALIAALIGVSLTAGNDLGGFDWRGVTAAGTAAVTLATYLVFATRVVRKVGPLTFIALIYPLAGVGLAVIIVVFGASWPETLGGWLALFATTGSHLAANLLFFKAVTFIEPARAAIIANAEPIWAIVFAWMLLGQSMLLIQLFGSLLVLTGVALTIIPERRIMPARVPIADTDDDT